MSRTLISTGSPMEEKAGYSRAVIQDNFAHVSGTTGYDYSTMVMPEDVQEQARNCLRTIQATLEEAGFTLSQVVRARYVVTATEHVEPVFETLGEVFGEIRPAATMIICGLVDPCMKVEIDVTAQR